jgi:hypothetical protein
MDRDCANTHVVLLRGIFVGQGEVVVHVFSDGSMPGTDTGLSGYGEVVWLLPPQQRIVG